MPFIVISLYVRVEIQAANKETWNLTIQCTFQFFTLLPEGAVGAQSHEY